MAYQSADDIRNRAFHYACQVANLAIGFAPTPGIRCIVDQLLKAGTAPGANLEEARAASSRREFVRYVEIALRETNESIYWLRLCVALQLGPKPTVEALRGEGEQIARILAAIVINTKRRMEDRADSV